MANSFAAVLADALENCWAAVARPNQLAPEGLWAIWLVLAGRGWGKTRTGAEWVLEQVSNGCRRIALVAATAADVRDVMVEGESGILACSPESNMPVYEPSKRRVTWRNGSIATTYSADEPERLRGPQHDAAWCDELASWRYPAAWDMLMFGLRLGRDPRVVVTTTPRPTKLIRDLVRDPTTIITRGSSYENRGNLAPAFFDQIVRKYEGTRLGRQELEAELLEDVPGALWSHGLIDAARLRAAPDLARVVVAIDPAVTSGEDSDETGIVVVGKDNNGHGYVLADLSGKYSPIEWAKIAITAYQTHRADRVVAETNNGGAMVEATLRSVDPNVAYSAVHASKGKYTRAEPASALYEQGRVHHVGSFPALEDQMTMFTPDIDRKAQQFSPDRVDALVWALTELLVAPMKSAGFFEVMRRRAGGETLEEIARRPPPPDPPKTSDQPDPPTPATSTAGEPLIEVYRREAQRLKDAAAAKK
jgi:phage terminase large subunit-like protein